MKLPARLAGTLRLGMLRHRVHRVLVTRRGRLVGLISSLNLAKLIVP